MAFSDIAATLTLFIAIIAILAIVVGVLGVSTSQLSDMIGYRRESVEDLLSGEFTITNVYYAGSDTSSNTFFVYLKNTGEDVLPFLYRAPDGTEISCFDIFLNDSSVGVIDASRIIYPENNTVYPQDKWMPYHTIRANLSGLLPTRPSNSTITVKVVGCQGLTDTFQFGTPAGYSGFSG